jgi:hypothetical protein
MSILKKYTIDFVVIISLLLLYFFYTDQGQKNLYSFISYSISKKAGLDVDITSLKLGRYPYVKADIVVEDKYNIHLHGYLSDMFTQRKFDMKYTLKSDFVQKKLTRIKGILDINGTLKGKRKYTELTGKGILLDGNVTYNLIKDKKVFKDVNLILKDINSSKLFKLFNQRVVFNGKADASLHLDYMDKKKKQGTIDYRVKDPDYHGYVVVSKSHVDIKDENHTFHIDINTPQLALSLTEGKYDEKARVTHGLFSLNVSDLSAFEDELGSKFLGEFNASGELTHNKYIHIEGSSKSFGGVLDFDYNKTSLIANLKGIPLNALLQRMNIDASLDANTTGTILYESKKREMQSNLTLHNAKMLESSFSKEVLRNFDYDISKEKFTHSTITASLKNKVLSSKIILTNKKHHIVLTNTKVDTKKKIIDTYVSLKTPNHFLEGDFKARLDEYITKDLFLKFSGIVEKYYEVTLEGLLNQKLVNMDYTLKSKRFPSHVCTIEDNVNIKGHINGPFTRLRIRGNGTALDGNISYDGVKISKRFEDVKLRLRNTHSLKLATLLGITNHPYGKADIQTDFMHISKDSYKGTIDYQLKNASYKTVPLSANTKIDVNEQKQTFTSNILLGGTKIDLSNGVRDPNRNITSAFFIVDSKNLSTLEKALGQTYMGPFYAMGNISYTDEIVIRGLTKTFGGAIDFAYQDELLLVDLERSSLKKILAMFTSKPLIDATTIGNINYDFKKKMLLVDTKLDNAKFEHSKTMDKVYSKSGIDIYSETFPDSSLKAHYKNKVLNANLNLESNTSFFRLNNVIMNNANKTINAAFDIDIRKQSFSGKVYGSIDDPKINLDMQKLLKHQVNKQLDTYMGESNRKLMESMPMGSTAKDMATDMGGGLMDIFF